MEWSRNGYVISDVQEAVDLDAVYAFLSTTYWGAGMLREVCERSLHNSLCFSLLHEGRLAGFCRVVTDRATIAYLADVFVLPQHRGRGLGKWLIACVLAHPELQGLRRMLLATADAHGLYARLGFVPLAQPVAFMEIHRPHIHAGHQPCAQPCAQPNDAQPNDAQPGCGKTGDEPESPPDQGPPAP